MNENGKINANCIAEAKYCPKKCIIEYSEG